MATPIEALDEIDSTNAEARRRADAGARGPLWITATRQTAGRGRRGPAWEARCARPLRPPAAGAVGGGCRSRRGVRALAAALATARLRPDRRGLDRARPRPWAELHGAARRRNHRRRRRRTGRRWRAEA